MVVNRQRYFVGKVIPTSEQFYIYRTATHMFLKASLQPGAAASIVFGVNNCALLLRPKYQLSELPGSENPGFRH